MTVLALGVEVGHNARFIHLTVLVPWTGRRPHADKRVIYEEWRSGGAWSWTVHLTYVEAHYLYTALAARVGPRMEDWRLDDVTIARPPENEAALEVTGTAFPFACMVPDVLAAVLLRGLRTHLDAVGFPHNIDLETGLDEGTRPWRGGICVCQLPGDPYHAHHDHKPHPCADCEACPRWRPAKEKP